MFRSVTNEISAQREKRTEKNEILINLNEF
jgi:hypothetical protein